MIYGSAPLSVTQILFMSDSPTVSIAISVFDSVSFYCVSSPLFLFFVPVGHADVMYLKA